MAFQKEMQKSSLMDEVNKTPTVVLHGETLIEISCQSCTQLRGKHTKGNEVAELISTDQEKRPC